MRRKRRERMGQNSNTNERRRQEREKVKELVEEEKEGWKETLNRWKRERRGGGKDRARGNENEGWK